MKALIGEDAVTGMLHSLEGTAASVRDLIQVGQLLHCQETSVFGDARYRHFEKRKAVKNQDAHRILAAKRRTIKASPERPEREQTPPFAKAEALIRSIVEPPFQGVKNRFSLHRVRYQGLTNSTAQLFSRVAPSGLEQNKHRSLGHETILSWTRRATEKPVDQVKQCCNKDRNIKHLR